jgi:hypothetical protein
LCLKILDSLQNRFGIFAETTATRYIKFMD